VSISHLFNGAKWLDWADSVAVTPKIEPLYPWIDRAMKRLSKPGKSAAAGGVAAVSEDRPAAGAMPLKRRIRHAVEAWQTESALRRFLDRPGQLSSRATLAAAQARYRAVLADLRAEMSKG
jgi:hypothetical protein